MFILLHLDFLILGIMYLSPIIENEDLALPHYQPQPYPLTSTLSLHPPNSYNFHFCIILL